MGTLQVHCTVYLMYCLFFLSNVSLPFTASPLQEKTRSTGAVEAGTVTMSQATGDSKGYNALELSQ